MDAFKIAPISHPILDTPCWEWSAAKFAQGYGAYSFEGKIWKAHRYSWIVHNGPIPDNMNVLHKCDNTACVNPDHLFLGTQHENMRDMAKKGRGRNRPDKVLTNEDLKDIRQLQGVLPAIRVSELFKTCLLRIYKIWNNPNYKPRTQSKNGTGFIGIKKTRNGRYTAGIWMNEKQEYLGTYDTLEEAIEVRKRIAEKYYNSYKM